MLFGCLMVNDICSSSVFVERAISWMNFLLSGIHMYHLNDDHSVKQLIMFVLYNKDFQMMIEKCHAEPQREFCYAIQRDEKKCFSLFFTKSKFTSGIKFKNIHFCFL